MDSEIEADVNNPGGAVNYFDGLPEGCIAKTLSLTSPKDACRLSCVSPIFKSAAESDAVWEQFLPDGYENLIPSSDYSSKKELYLRLCDHPVLIDDGRKSFSLDKQSGKKCYMLSARSLTIVWGDTPEYWQWISIPESRFPEVALLKAVCWFDICGRIRSLILSPNTSYSAYFVFKTTTDSYGLAFQQIDVSVGIVGSSEPQNRLVYFSTESQRREYWGYEYPYPNVTNDDARDAVERGDGWMEVELGDFFNGGDEDDEVEFSIREIHTGHWKNGIIVEGIEIRPKRGD